MLGQSSSVSALTGQALPWLVRLFVQLVWGTE